MDYQSKVERQRHTQWLMDMRARLPDYLEHSEELFAQCKWEAERMHNYNREVTSLDCLHGIMGELGLKLVVN